MRGLRSSTAIRAVLVASMIMQPVTAAYAQSAPAAPPRVDPPIVAQGPNTRLNITPTGTPIVEIAAPDGRGTSYNVFQRFNVFEEGTILNNSAEIGQSLLGGQLLANPNLIPAGREADLIIAEVTGGNRSQLRGPLEVFGQKAGVVIANPAGISCDGCGFVNISRLTLSTGVAQFGPDGAFSGLAVTEGNVTVEGRGLLAGNVDFFDIISLTSQINADIFTRDLLISAGASDFDYEQRLSQSRGQSGTGVAIDTTLLGGMFANRIRLVGNDLGVGINLRGAVATLQDDIDIQASGGVIVDNAVSAGDLNIGSSSDIVNIADRAYAVGSLSITAADNVQTSGQFVGAGGDVTISSGGNIAVNNADIYAGLMADGTLTSSASASLSSAGNGSVVGGNIFASQNTSFAAQDLLVDGGSQISAANVNIDAATANIGGNISAQGDVGLQTGSLNASGNVFANGELTIDADDAAIGGNLVGLSALTVDIARDLTVAAVGSLQTNGNLGLSANGIDSLGRIIGVSAVNADIAGAADIDGIIASGGDLSFSADGDTNISGTLSAQDNLSFASGDSSVGGTLAANGTLAVTAGQLGLSGTILGGSAATVAASDLVAVGGQVSSNGDVTITSAQDIDFAGAILAGGDLSLDASGQANIAGNVQASGQLNIDADSVDLGGQITADAGINAAALGALDVDGNLQSLSEIVLNAGAGLNLSGGTRIASGGTLNFSAGENLLLDGDISAVDNITFSVSAAINNLAAIDTLGDVALAANEITSSGTIGSAGLASLNADVVNIDGRLIGSGLSVEAANITTGTDADLQSDGDLSLIASQTLNLAGSSLSTGDSFFQAGDDITFNIATQSGGNVEASAATLLSGNGSAIAAGSLDYIGANIDSALDLSAAGGIGLESRSGNLVHAGSLLSETAINLGAANDLNIAGSLSSGGLINISGRDLTLDGAVLAEGATDILLSGNGSLAGSISGNGAITITASNIDTAAVLITQDDVALTASGSLINEGAISALGNVDLDATGSLTQVGDIETGNALSLSASDPLALSGNLAASNDIVLSGQTISIDGTLSTAANIVSSGAENINLSANSSLVANDSLNLAAVDNIDNAGSLGSNGDVSISADSVRNSGAIESSGLLSVTSATALDNTAGGRLNGIGGLALAAGSIALDGIVQSGGNADLETVNGLTLIGTLSATDNITVEAGSLTLDAAASLLSNGAVDLDITGSAQLAGTLSAASNISVDAASISSNGAVSSAGDIALNQLGLGGLDLLGGTVSADGNVTLTGDQVTINNDLTGLQSLLVTAQTLTSSADSLLQSGGGLTLRSANDAQLAGDLLSIDALDVRGDAGLSITGDWQSGAATTAMAGSALTLDGDLLSAGAINASSDAITVRGLLQSDAVIDLISTGAIDISGDLLTQGAINLDAASQINLSGSALSGGNLDLAANSLSLTGSLGTSGDLTVDIGGLLNTSADAVLEANGAIGLDSGSLASAADIFAGTSLAINVDGDATLGGLVQAGDILTLNADNFTSSAELVALGDVTINALSDIALDSGSLASGGALSLNGTNITSDVELSADANLILNATGDLTSSGALVGGAVLDIDGRNITLGDASALTGISVDASEDLTVNGTILSNGDIALNGGDVLLNTSSSVGSQETIAIGASDSLTNAGTLSAVSNISLNAAADLTHSGTILSDANVRFTAGAGAADSLTLTGDVEAAGLIDIDGASITLDNALTGLGGVDVRGNDITVTALTDIQSGTSLDLIATNDLDIAGSLLSLGSLNLDAGNDLSLAGTAQSGASADVSAANRLDFTGTLIAEGAVVISAPDLRLTSGSIGASNALSVVTTGDLDLGTGLSSLAEINVSTDGALGLTGDLISNTSVILDAGSINASGIISGAQLVDIDAVGSLTLTDSAVIASDSNIAATAGAINNVGLISSGNDTDIGALTVTANDAASTGITNSGAIESSGSLSVTSAAAIDNTTVGRLTSIGGLALTAGSIALDGIVQSGGNADLEAANSLTLTGSLSVNDSINVEAGDIALQTGSLLVTGNNISLISSGDAALDGTLFAPGILDISAAVLTLGGVVEAQGLFTANVTSADIGGSLFSDQLIDIDTGAGDFSLSGILVSDISIDLDGRDITATNSAQIFSGGLFTATASRDISLDGTLSAVGAISLDAGRDAIVAATVISEDSFAAQAVGLLNQSGSVETARGLTLGGDTVNISGRLTGLGALSIDGGNISLAGGSVIQSADSITVTAAQNLTASGDLLTASAPGLGDIDLNAAGDLDAAGTITSSGNSQLTSGDLLTSTSDVETGGSLGLAGNGVSTSGTLLSGGALSINANSGPLLINGGISSAANIALTTTGQTTANGVLIADTILSIDTGSLSLNAAASALDSIALNSSAVTNISAQGSLLTNGSIAANVGALNNAGSISTFGNGLIDIAASGAVANSGLILSGGALELDGASLINSSDIGANGLIEITTTAITNITETGRIIGQDDVTVNAGTIDVAGLLRAETNLGLRSTGSITTHSNASVSAAQNVALTSNMDSNVDGLIVAGGTLNVDAAGNVNGAAALEAGTQLLVEGVDIDLQGYITSFGITTLSASSDLTLGGETNSVGVVTLGGQQLLLSASAQLFSDDDIGITASSFESLGLIGSAQDIIATADQITLSNGLTAGGNINLTATGNFALSERIDAGDPAASTTGSIGAVGTVTVSAGNLSSIGNITGLSQLSITADNANLGATSALVSNGQIILNATGDVDSAGQITGVTGVTAIVAGALNKTSGTIISNGDIDVDAGGAFSNTGAIGTGATLSIDAASINSSGNLTGNAAVSLTTVSGDITLAGRVDTLAADIIITSAANLTNSATIVSDDLINVSAIGNFSNSGILFAQNSLIANAGLLLDNNGSLLSAGALTLTAGSLNNSGVLEAVNSFAVTANAITLDGTVTSGGNIDFTATGGPLSVGATVRGDNITLNSQNGSLTVTNGADIGAFENAGLSASGNIQIDGLIGSNISTQLTSISGDIVLGANGNVGSAQALSVNVGDAFSSQGILQAGNAITLNANTINSGSIFSNSNINLTGVNQVTVNGTIDAVGAVSVRSNTDAIEINNGATLLSGGAIALDAATNIVQAGIVDAATNIDLQTAPTGTINSTGTIVTDSGTISLITGNATLGGIVSTSGLLTIDGSDLEVAGLVQSGGALNGTFDTVTVTNAGRLHSDTAISLDVTSLTNDNVISSGGTLNIDAIGQITNNAGFTVGGDPNALFGFVADNDITLNAVNIRGQGDIATAGALTIVGGTLEFGGAISATDALNISGSSLTVSGTIGSATSVTTASTGSTVIQTSGVISAGASNGSGGIISLTSGGSFSNAGTISGNQNITLAAQNDLVSSGSLFSNTLLGFTSTAGDIDLSGSVIGLNGIAVNGRDIDITAELASNGDITLGATRNIAINSELTGNDIGLTAVNGLLSFGADSNLLSSGNVTANAAQIENDGIIGAAGNVNIIATTSIASGLSADIDTDGLVNAGGNVVLTASDDIVIAGGNIDTAANGTVLRQVSGQNITLNGNQTSVSGAVIGANGVAFNGTSNADAASVTLLNGAIISSSAGNVAANLGASGAGIRSFDAQAGSSIFANNEIVLSNSDTVNIAGNANGLSGVNIAVVNNIAINGSLQSNGAINLNTSAAGDSDTANITGIVGGSDVTIGTGILTNSGTLTATNDLDLTAANANLSGTVGAGRDIEITATALTVNSDATVTAGRNLIGNASSTTTVNGTLGAGSLVSLWPDQLNIGATGLIFSNGDIEINSTNITPIAGTIQAQGSTGAISIAADGELAIAGSGQILSQAGGIDLTAGTNVTQGGRVQSANQVNVTASTGNINVSGVTASGSGIALNAAQGNIAISASGILNVAGSASSIALDAANGAGANINLSASDVISNAGNIFTDGSIFAQSQNANITNSGQITGLGETVLRGDSGSFINDAGDIFAGSLAVYQTTDFENTGSFTAANNLLIDAPNITNSGLLGSNGDLQLISGGIFANTGTVFTGGDLNINAVGDLTNDQGIILALGNIDLTAANVLNSSARIESLGGSININTGNLTNEIKTLTIITDGGPGSGGDQTVTVNTGAANIVSATNLSINAAATVTNSNSNILAGGDINITAATVNNVADTVRRTVVSGLDNIVTVCLQAGLNGTGCSEPETGTVQQIRDLGLGNFLNRPCTGRILSGCLVSGDPTVTSVTSDIGLPTIIQANGTLTINATQLGNGSFIDGTTVSGSGDMVPVDNGTAGTGISSAAITVGSVNGTGVTTGNAAVGSGAGTAQTFTGQNIENAGGSVGATGEMVADISGGGVSGPLNIADVMTGSGENAVGAGLAAGGNVLATGAGATTIAVGPVTAGSAESANGTSQLGGPVAVNLDGSVTGPTGPDAQAVSAVNIMDATSNAGGGTGSTDDLAIGDQIEITPEAVGDLIVETSAIGAVDAAELGELNANPLAGQMVTSDAVGTVDMAVVDPDAAAISSLPTGDQLLLVGEASAQDAAIAQVAFGPATLAVPGILGNDGGLGSFLFNFLGGFNLVDAQNGFGLAGGNTLFTFNNAPGTEFLFTTNPGFAGVGDLFDSNFFFDQLDIDRDTTFLRLGDGFFESLLIADQVKEATRQSQLPQFGDKLEQAQALMQAAVNQQSGLGLSLGVALTADQVVALDQSIVWWVSQLVDGREVLVPVVYLSAADQKSLGNSALIAGNNVVLNVQGDIDNPGQIEAANILSIDAGGSIVNRDGGSITGGTIFANAAQDIINRNASITGGDINLTAGRDVDIGAVTTVTTTSQRTDGRKGRFSASESTTTTVSGSTITATGNLNIGAGRDINVTASDITAGGNTTLTAQRDLTIGGITGENSSSSSFRSGKKRYGSESSSNQVFEGSSITAGGNLNLGAAGAVAITGSDLAAGGNASIIGNEGVTISSATETSTASLSKRTKRNTDAREFTGTTNVLSTVDAGGDLLVGSLGDVTISGGSLNSGGAANVIGDNVTIAGVIDSSSETIDTKRVKKGLLSKKTTTTRIESDQELVIQSTLSGDTVNVSSVGDTTILGSNIVGTGDVTLNSGGDTTIGALQQNNRDLEDVQVKRSGISLSGGSLFIGKSKTENEDGIKTGSNVGSLVGSSDGNVSIAANNDVVISGSQIVAPGLASISGQSILIENEVDVTETTGSSKSKSVGVTIGVTNPLLAGAQTTRRLTEIGTRTENARTAAVAAVAGGLSVKNTIDAVKKNPAALGGVNVSASIGFSKSKSENTTSDETVIGSVISAGDVALSARGAGADSTIDVIGSEIQATGDITVIAEGDITFAAATETDTQSGSSSSSGASLGVSVGVGPQASGAAVNASFNKSSSEYSGTDVTNIESNIVAGGNLTIGTPGALTIDGSTVSGEQVSVDAGSLDIISRQDTSTFESSNNSVGVSVSVSATGQVSGSANLGKGEQSGEFASVQEQAGIFAGSGGFDINVEGATNLTGAVIASEGDAADNSLNTGSITFKEIENREEFSANQVNIGGGFGGVGKDDDGKAEAGGDKVPGLSLPKLGDFSATLPSALSASGDQSGTTLSAIDPATITIGGVTGAPEGLSRDTSTANDGALTKEFTEEKRAEIDQGFEVTRQLVAEIGTFRNNRAQEATQKEAEADAAEANGDFDTAKRLREEAAAWGPGSTGSQALSALTVAASGNVTGSIGTLVQDFAVSTLQQLAAERVGDGKNILSDEARAVLHGLIGCVAGTASSAGTCGSGAAGQGGTSLLTSLFEPKEDATPEEKQAYSQIIQTLVTIIGTAAGTEGSELATALAGAQAEVDNNATLVGKDGKLVASENGPEARNDAEFKRLWEKFKNENPEGYQALLAVFDGDENAAQESRAITDAQRDAFGGQDKLVEFLISGGTAEDVQRLLQIQSADTPLAKAILDQSPEVQAAILEDIENHNADNLLGELSAGILSTFYTDEEIVELYLENKRDRAGEGTIDKFITGLVEGAQETAEQQKQEARDQAVILRANGKNDEADALLSEANDDAQFWLSLKTAGAGAVNFVTDYLGDPANESADALKSVVSLVDRVLEAEDTPAAEQLANLGENASALVEEYKNAGPERRGEIKGALKASALILVVEAATTKGVGRTAKLADNDSGGKADGPETNGNDPDGPASSAANAERVREQLRQQDVIRNADNNLDDIRRAADEAGALPTSTSGFALVEIDGIPDGTVLKASSGIDDATNGFIGEGGKNFDFDTVPTSTGFPAARNVDVEYKILDNIADQLGNNRGASGAVTIVIDNPAVCSSCQSVIDQFNARYPNIKVDVIKRPKPPATGN